MVLHDVGIFDIADGVWDLLHIASDALIALAADAGGPVHRLALARTALPCRADLAQIMREVEGRARAIRAMDYGNIRRWKRYSRIDARDRRIAPLRHTTGKDIGEQRSREPQLARLNAADVHHRNDSADHDRKLRELALGELVRRKRLVCRPKVDRASLDLRDPAPGADRLIIDVDAALLLVVGRPGGKHRIDESRAGARHSRALAGGLIAVVRLARSKQRRERQGDEQFGHEQFSRKSRERPDSA